jgi:hypothetical protein
MQTDQAGAREAKIAGLSFGLLFSFMFGLLAVAESRDETRKDVVGSVGSASDFRPALKLRLTKFAE